MVKRLLSALSVILLCVLVNAQVTTEPAFITKGYKGEIIVTFNPAEGNGGMKGATACYAHTGLITSESKSGSDWKYATPEWRDGSDKYKMTKNGDVWTLTIPNIYEYYGCPESEEIFKMAFVFNDGPSGSKEGKTADGSDIFVELVDAGLSVKFESPVGNQLLDKGTKTDFKLVASEECTITLYVNDTEVKSAQGTELNHEYTFDTEGNFTCVAKAVKGEEEKYDSIFICVAAEATNESRPAGLQDGITYYEDDATKVTLSLYYKDNNNKIAQNVFVIGDFNDWAYTTEYQMKKDGETGYFWLDITGLEPGKEYVFQYAVKRPNGAMVQISDAYTHKTVDPNDHYISEDIYPNQLVYPAAADGPCAVIQTARKPYKWSDATINFKRPDKNNLVIYELWVYDFSPLHSFDAITKRLDYIENLGVNAIEFMPICEFEGNVSWGYNPTHYFALDKAYGTPESFKALVDECHKRGIAVIVDMVFNHATGWAPFNKVFGGYDNLIDNPYFNTKAPHDGNVFEDFNHEFDGTLNHFTRVLNYWLEEYKIDGYRMDLSHGFCGPNCNEQKRIMYHYFNEGVKAVDPNAYFILEHWDGNRSDYANNGMMCWENTSHAYYELAMGWYNGSNSSALYNANKDNYVSYAESHDEERCQYKAMQWGNGAIKTDKATRLNRTASYLAMSTMLNGPQMLWMFEEIGYDFSINSNEKGEGEDEGNRTSPKPQPEALKYYQDAERMNQYKIMGQINQLRTRILPKVFEGNPTAQDLAHGRPIRSITWGDGVNRVFVVSNVSVTPQECTLPTGTTNWYDYLANNPNALPAESKITLNAGEVKVYTAQYFQLPEVPTKYVFDDYVNIEDVEFKSNCVIYPTISEDIVFIEASEEIQSVEVINIQGQKMMTENSVNTINISSLPQGVYMVIINFNNTQEAHKIYRK